MEREGEREIRRLGWEEGKRVIRRLGMGGVKGKERFEDWGWEEEGEERDLEIVMRRGRGGREIRRLSWEKK